MDPLKTGPWLGAGLHVGLLHISCLRGVLSFCRDILSKQGVGGSSLCIQRSCPPAGLDEEHHSPALPQQPQSSSPSLSILSRLR